MTDEANELMFYSNKHKSLYLYVYRILRPIWHLNVTYYQKASNLSEQRFNLAHMNIVKNKLENVYELIHKYEKVFIGSHCKNKQLIQGTKLSADTHLINSLE